MRVLQEIGTDELLVLAHRDQRRAHRRGHLDGKHLCEQPGNGVAVEARKWAWSLGELGFDVRRVAGAIEDDGQPGDTVLPGLALGAAGVEDRPGRADRGRGEASA